MSEKLTSKTAASRCLLKGNRCAAIIAVIMPLIMYFAVIFAECFIQTFFFPLYESDIKNLIIAAFAVILSSVLVYPLQFGEKYCFYSNCSQKHIPLFGVFEYYSSFKKFFYASLCVLLKKAVVFTAFFILVLPCCIVLKYTFDNNLAVYFQIGAALVLGSGVFLWISIFYSLFLAEYIIMASDVNPFYALFLSCRYMRRRRSSLIYIQIGFIPKFLLCVLVIPLIYVVPLYKQTTAAFANRIIFYSPIYPPVSLTDI